MNVSGRIGVPLSYQARAMLSMAMVWHTSVVGVDHVRAPLVCDPTGEGWLRQGGTRAKGGATMQQKMLWGERTPGAPYPFRVADLARLLDDT